MKTHRMLGWVAMTIFFISFLLPAYSGASGFTCFANCWNIFLGHDTDILSGGWFYYSGFVIANILCLGLVAALFITQKSRKLRAGVSIICFLQVSSWLVLNAFCERPSQIAEIGIGYYLWLTAYGLLIAAHLCKTTPFHTPWERTPAAPSVLT